MAEAEVGDDVYGEDPTLRRLEETAAETLGFEAALFVPTGSMGNQVAINVLTEPGTEVVLEAGTHVYNYELAAMTAWSGALPRVLVGERGLLDPDAVRAAISPDVYYMAPTTLLVLENTHNHAGGIVLDAERRDALLRVARDAGISVHLDGARIFNAAAAMQVPVAEVARGYDTVMFCLSKGLGAPVGSLVCGSAAFRERGRVVRKRMGGGMRQAGVLAAAGLVALRDNVERLVEDHLRATRLAEALAAHGAFSIDPAAVQTNIVTAGVRPAERRDEILESLRKEGILAGAMGPGRVRFVTHLDVDEAGMRRAIDALARVR
jgi:threonine aldolase